MNDPGLNRRPRVSLLNLLLLVTIFAMGVGVWRLYAELAPLRAENRRLRDEVGEISLTDTSKLHAIRVATPGEPLLWKWRVWLPAGKNYKLRSSGGVGEVPKSGFPTDGGTISLSGSGDGGREIWVEYRIAQNREGAWWGNTRTRQGSVGAEHHPWVDKPGGRASTNGGVGQTTRVADGDAALVLARYRTAPVSSSTDIPDPADGFLVWIEPR